MDSTANVPPTSRLCVKNIPKYANESRLREHFSKKGEVTDVRVVKTRDGKSRQMAFVGYKSVDEAVGAVKFFNRSFMDTAKLEVEFAWKYGDSEINRPWSKHSDGSSARKKVLNNQAGGESSKLVDGHAAEVDAARSKGKVAENGTRTKKGSKTGESQEEEDPRLAEFLALMAPRSKARVWANDDSVPLESEAVAGGKPAGALKHLQAGSEDDDEDDDEEYMEFMQPGARKGADDSDVDVDEDSNDGGQAENAVAKQVVNNAALSDLDYLKARVSSWDDVDDDDFAAPASDVHRGDQSGVGTSQQSAGLKKKSLRKADDDSAVAARGDGAAADDEEDKEEGDAEEKEEDSDDEDDTEMKDTGPSGAGEMVVEAEMGYGRNSGDNVEELIADTGRLFLRNLPYSTTEADLSDLFGDHGQLQEVHLVLDRETKKSKGIAYILFQMPEDAVQAYRDLDGHIFQGRLLHILPAKRPPTLMAARTGLAEDDGTAGGSKKDESFKGQRAAQRKEDAGDRSVWNTLFMRADTVAEAVAAHYGVTKAELLDKGAADLPVRMALGEAHVISQTKMALAEAGVDITKIESAASASGKASQSTKVARSPNSLLVKNLPYSTSEEDLQELFSRSGPLARLVLPSTKTMAIVEFLEPGDARSAFKALAYKKFQHVPLYLEWAPKDVFSTPTPDVALPKSVSTKVKADPASEKAVARAAVGEATGLARAPTASQPQQADSAQDADAEEDDGASTTIFVKNVAFASTDAQLKKHFDKAVSSVGGTLHSARIAWKKGRDGKLLSMGYGFVECDSEAAAKATIKKLQGSSLDGHKLVLQLSSRKEGADGKGASNKNATSGSDSKASKVSSKDLSTKLVVRNVAFEATRKDMMGLFSPFGSIKSCRLPKKFDGNHRGFAFVEYVTKQEAKNALQGVAGTHLYGRRLVVEYAEEGEGLEDIRAKTAAKFQDDDAPRAKRPRAAK